MVFNLEQKKIGEKREKHGNASRRAQKGGIKPTVRELPGKDGGRTKSLISFLVKTKEGKGGRRNQP